MYDRNTSGTPEKIYGTFSPDTGFHASNPQVHMLFDAPVPGAAKVVEIDMEKQFGVKVAPISSISQYQILQAIHTDVLLDENRYEIEAFVFEIHHVQSNTILRNEVEAPCFDCLKKLPSKKVLDSETINGVLYPVWKHPLELKEWTVRERLYPGTMHTSGPCLPKTFNQRKCDRDPIYHGYPPVLAVA
ncbi:hypothetical protein RJ55_01076 [Drechmeria coniospora]|nr:hypothetical protein RJ55_01076 [Drechmeria coniospora]